MLLLNSPRTITVDGVTVLPDHADPDQFWYLPGPVSLAHNMEGRAAFTFLKYKPATVASGVKGGGYAIFTVCLKLDPRTEQRIRSRLGSLAHGEPKLAAVQFDQGSVKCVALNLEGSGGTAAKAPPPNAFNAVEEILGSTTPSMSGDEEALFSLVLSQEGAIILEQAFKQGAAPIGVVYQMTYTGLRPALNVKITADLKRVYDGLSASLSGQYYFFQAGIDAAFEKLKQDGAIKITVVDPVSDADSKEKEKWALDFFKEDLLAKWFEPTLSVGQPAVTTPSASGSPLPNLGSLPGASPAPSAAPQASPAPSAAPASSPSTSTSSSSAAAAAAPAAAPATSPAAAATPAPAPAAHFEITSRTPNPSPAGFGITHTPSASGTKETLLFTGGDAPPQVQIDGGSFQTLSADRQITIDVAPGTSHSVLARWPNQTQQDTFDLYFSYDKPAEAGFSTSETNPVYRSYLLGTVSSDPIYTHNHRQGSSAATQVQALQEWLQTVPPGTGGRRTVDIDAHASYEGDDTKGEHNSNLSQRRLEVARGVLHRLDPQLLVGNGGIFLGFTEAKAAGRISQPADNPDGSPNQDRVARIRGNVPVQTVSIGGTITRAATPTPTPGPTTTPQPTPSPSPSPTPHPSATPAPSPTPKGSGSPAPSTAPPATAGNPAISLRIKFVHQEELKTLTFEYNRQDATQRSYNPPGQFGLMLQDLADSDKLFLEIDLDDPFFRTLAVNASMPIDFARIGLKSAHVALDYGNPADPQNHRTGDFIFSPADAGDKHFEVFLNKQLDLGYRYLTDLNFDPQSNWNADRFSYKIGPIATDDRNLFVNPYEHLGFLEVTLFPHEVDAAIVDSIDVTIQPLKADLTPAGPEKLVHVLPDSPDQVYRFRSEDRSVVSYSYRTSTLLKDGTVRTTDPKISRASRLAVNDPFDDALAIELVPLYDTAAVKLVFIDIEYDDAPNNYHRRERVTMEGNAPRSTLRIALMNKAQRQFRFRFTFIGTNNQIQSGAFKDTAETILAVAP